MSPLTLRGTVGRILLGDTSSFDKIVKLACEPKPAPPKAKYLDPIIAATWSEDGAIYDICKALVLRLQEPNTIVVFKALIVLHTTIRNGATDSVLSHLSSSEDLRLRNVSNGNWEGYNTPQNIQHYALYLDSRIRVYRELEHDAIRVQAEANRRNNSTEKDMEYATMPGPNASESKTPQRSKTIAGGMLRVMTVESGLLREIKAVQKMIGSLVECRFYLDDLEDELNLTALIMLVKDLLVLFQAGNEGVINMLEHYFEMPRYDAQDALSIYRNFCDQTERVAEFLGIAKKLQNLLNVPIPNLKPAPLSLASPLLEYLNDPNFEQNRLEYKQNKAAADSNSKDRTASAQEQGLHDNQRSTLASYEGNLPDSPEEPGRFQSPSCIIHSNHLSRGPTFQELDLQIDDNVLDSWKSDRLTNADALLSTAITTSQNRSYHSFASRALVRARLKKWDTAIMDAEKAVEIQPSVISYISKSIALVGKGERHKGYRACDIAFVLSHSSHLTFLLLVKAIIVFMAGECCDAISRVDDLIGTVPFDPIYIVVQAYMYLLVGKSQMKNSDYEAAIQSFKCAGAKMQHHASQSLLVISLISGWKFDDLDVSIRQGLCEALYGAGRISDAVEYFNQMKVEPGEQMNWYGDYRVWALEFRQRSSKKLEYLGDTAMGTQRYDEAISHYTTLLSFNLQPPQGILAKRGNAFMATGSWKQAVDDINQVIALDPSSPSGYEMMHVTLHKAADYNNAVNAFEAMLSRMEQSPDPDIRHRREQYKTPLIIRARIRKIVHRALRDLPRVLINTTTGRLHDRAEQASAFESLPIFNELVSSMTTRIDCTRIKREVQEYFRYVMLSHKWEDNEPLFQQVMHVAVYDLDHSSTNDKLQTFCKIVRDSGFIWAWSDTCCINKSDHFVLQEALVAMFKWYQGATLVIVFLRGVHSSSERGALVRSIWNTRAWTLQEYIAARLVHFYTEDWSPYLDLQLSNHKESQEVISEMEEATKMSSEQLTALRPGLTSIREKLRLASTRQTTLIEDAAYSLLGIFSVAGLSAIYGEGEASLGRLLSYILAGSGDESILAWTGESGRFNSCLPAYISVFNGPATSHIPPPISDAEMEVIISTSHSSFDSAVALTLYDRLHELPAPWFAASRMKLPCIAFGLPSLTPYRTRSGRVYHADTATFGMVEIKTRHDLSRMKSLYLVHPWLDALLEREGRHSGVFIEDDLPPLSPDSDDEEISDEEIDDSTSVLVPELPSLSTPEHVTLPMAKEARVRRFAVRLRQPFGALLVALASSGQRSVDYRRVAADSLITVQIQDNVSLTDILDKVRVLDIL